MGKIICWINVPLLFSSWVLKVFNSVSYWISHCRIWVLIIYF